MNWEDNQELLLKDGLTQRDKQTILSILKQFDSIKKAILFGSRAKGTSKSGSDIDLALEFDTPDTFRSLIRIKEAFSESSLPYFTDILDISKISNTSLLQQIWNEGVVIYEK